MPPKKPVAEASDPPKAKEPDAAAPRKPPAHPSTSIMVKEALEALDSRKGVSSMAIKTYIKRKYPSVDEARLKHLVRNALKKGIETGTLVRPASSGVVVGALGKFRIATKEKEAKPKSENADPNVQKVPKATKESAKKSPKAGASKKKDAAEEQNKSQEESNPPKKEKDAAKEQNKSQEKGAAAKKPKGKAKAAEKGEDEGASASAKPKAAKETKAASQKTKDSRNASATKPAGRRAKKPAA
ncbi:linker histone H1M [Brachionichthys hirsutus]|uniref:linker histone H1M n=1 Tax=Brachionichthys hirsutus TaxID=412623 RepID=UPI00360481CB